MLAAKTWLRSNMLFCPESLLLFALVIGYRDPGLKPFATTVTSDPGLHSEVQVPWTPARVGAHNQVMLRDPGKNICYHFAVLNAVPDSLTAPPFDHGTLGHNVDCPLLYKGDQFCGFSLRKHAYSNILKILQTYKKKKKKKMKIFR